MPETPVFSRAAVAAPHGLAGETGRAILADGGNAVEAMIAMAATIAVVYPHMNAIGGDAFWLIREPGGRVRGIDACGPVGGWRVALDYARSLGGKMPLATLLGEAMRFARDGYPVSASEGREEAKELEALKQAPGFLETFFVEGKPAPAGHVRRMPRLAE